MILVIYEILQKMRIKIIITLMVIKNIITLIGN